MLNNAHTFNLQTQARLQTNEGSFNHQKQRQRLAPTQLSSDRKSFPFYEYQKKTARKQSVKQTHQKKQIQSSERVKNLKICTSEDKKRKILICK